MSFFYIHLVLLFLDSQVSPSDHHHYRFHNVAHLHSFTIHSHVWIKTKCVTFAASERRSPLARPLSSAIAMERRSDRRVEWVSYSCGEANSSLKYMKAIWRPGAIVHWQLRPIVDCMEPKRTGWLVQNGLVHGIEAHRE